MIDKIIRELKANKFEYWDCMNDGDKPDLLVSLDRAIEIVKKYDNDGWIEFELGRDDEREILVNPLPEDDEEVLITDGKNVWMTTFFNDGEECYFDDGSEFITEVIAWKKKPSPFVKDKSYE